MLVSRTVEAVAKRVRLAPAVAVAFDTSAAWAARDMEAVKTACRRYFLLATGAF